jgi:apolipoprotein D and lipocalin family protein
MLPLLLLAGLAGCAGPGQKPISVVEHVNLERFMGDWYVVGNIPTFLERDAHNAVESYRLEGEGRVATTFTFRRGGFDGPRKSYRATGFVLDPGSNAVWGMQFLWPIRADYRIIHLDEGYRLTVIGRQKRDYAWVMSRTPEIAESDWQRMVGLLRAEGYDTDSLRRVPQRWG